MRTRSVNNSGIQFKRLIIVPSSAVKNWPVHTGLVSVDATYLRKFEKEILVLDSCYNNNQRKNLLVFFVVRTEDAASWAWFLERVVSSIT